MNYGEHGLIGAGTAGVAIWAIQQTSIVSGTSTTVLLGGLAASLGAIAVDIDHPQAFVSRGLPREILSRLLPLLIVPVVLAIVATNNGGDFMAMLSPWRDLIQLGLLGIALALGLMAISLIIFKTLGHRGPLHSLFFSLFMTVVAIVTVNVALDKGHWWLGLCFGWGWLSHVLADGFTPQGVPFWWPFESERKHFGLKGAFQRK